MKTGEVIKFMGSCPQLGGVDIICTDFVGMAPLGCGLHDLGAEVAGKNIIGKRTFLHSYTLYLRLGVASEEERGKNLEKCRGVQRWILEKDEKREYPNAGGEYSVLGMQAGAPQLERQEGGAASGRYKLPFNIKYEEK